MIVSARLGWVLFSLVSGCGLLSGTTYNGGAGAFSSGGTQSAMFVTSNAALASGSQLAGYVAVGAGMSAPTGSTAIIMNMVGPLGGALTGGTALSPVLISNFYDDVECDSSFTMGPSGVYAFQGSSSNKTTIRLGGPLTFSTDAYLRPFLGSQVILDGGGNILTVNDASCIYVRSTNTSLILRNMTLILRNTSVFFWEDSSSQLTLDNVKVVFAATGGGNYLLDPSGSGYGKVSIANNVSFTGVGSAQPVTFTFNSNQSFTILSGAQLTIGDGVVFRYAPLTRTNNNLIKFTDATSKLKFDNATLQTTSGTGKGLVLKGGMVIFDNLCYVQNTTGGDGTGSAGSAASGGVVIGDGASAANDVDVRLLAGAAVVVNGYLQYNHS